MINSLSSQLNAANNQNNGICRLSDLRIGVPYEVLSFQRLQSRFGDTIVASLIPIGCLQEASIRVFLPKRFNDVLTEDEIQKYNNKVIRSVNLIYRGLVNRQHDLQFMASSSKQCSICGANFVTVRACQLHELSCTRASPQERSPSPASPSMWVTNNEYSTRSTDEEEYSDPMNKTYAVMPSSRESPPRKKMKTYSPSPTPSFEDYSRSVLISAPKRVGERSRLPELVFNVLMGFVRSPIVITFIQVMSRVAVVGGLLYPARSAQVSVGLPLILTAWSITEIIRYSFYALNLINAVPYFLVWCRYTFFYALYPIGVTGELLLYYATQAHVAETKMWTAEMPNAMNFTFNYRYLLLSIMAFYVPQFPQMYLHMINQRKKVISGASSSGSAPSTSKKVK
ncbi:hypothetical protein GE061_002283 [Apolygus lucorum]|uniref:Very-long-chain (3R)-3-hydroxyacyl-CoA dehydratase n=1 Tax=Apolygus lucorum TaxID=248454 RepID=A0A8S9X8P5_APOLU|nr:hypothetical protein GE061_002283 [Apolygus lucorum]